jgi:hypothetical protein
MKANKNINLIFLTIRNSGPSPFKALPPTTLFPVFFPYYSLSATNDSMSSSSCLIKYRYSAVVIHYLKNRQVRSADDDRPVVETIENLLEQVEGLLGQVHPELLDQARHELQLGQGQGELAGDQPESAQNQAKKPAKEESVETYRSSHIRRRRSGIFGGQVRKKNCLERE